jgi:hypothetical protein
MVTTLPADAGAEGELFRANGFSVASWELQRTLG